MPLRGTPPSNPGPPQAVVIIHGIGEQRPMATLRGFVGALLDGSSDACDRPGDRYYSKPDTISDSYELRRIKLRRAGRDSALPDGINLDWPETDFYEYYWAHQMYGTTASHVVRWLRTTLWRSWRFIGADGRDFPRLRCMAILAWLTVAVLLGAVATFLWYEPNVPWLDSPASAAGAVALALALWHAGLRYSLGAVLDVMGDAARYFDVNPKNVARRYDILRGGIALLHRLHEDRDVQGDLALYRYGRIVLVGHSLGSVIAYDILRHYWAQVNGRIPVDPGAAELREVERFVSSKEDSPPSNGAACAPSRSYWSAQYDLWKTMSDRVPAKVRLSRRDLWRRRASCESPPTAVLTDWPAARDEPQGDWQPARWLVSDLVTLGSPLAYAPVLVADGLADLNEKIGLRELPTCPPDPSRRVNPGHYSVRLSGEASRFDDYSILHHGALFAPTRWTNLWYANDPVGGPLRPAFGRGIWDIRLPDAPFSPLKSHLSYWRRMTSSGQPKGTRILAAILRDCHGQPTRHGSPPPPPPRPDRSARDGVGIGRGHPRRRQGGR